MLTEEDFQEAEPVALHLSMPLLLVLSMSTSYKAKNFTIDEPEKRATPRSGGDKSIGYSLQAVIKL